MMPSEKLQSAFQKFGKLLDTRFSKNVFTTEDSVRYTFFNAMSSVFELVPDDIVLESIHPNIDGHKEIDMLIPEKKDCPELVFEFKYDRKIPSGTNSPRPQKAGHLFADIFRQFRYKKEHQKSKCFLIYVTDFEQANYLSKEENRLDDFFKLLNGQTLQINLDYINNHSDTFVNAAKTYGIHECKILSCLNTDLKNSNFVRIFEIQLILR